MPIGDVRKKLRELSNPQKAEIVRKFFKTGPGEYGEGDIFLGIAVPVLRKLVKQFVGNPLDVASRLLESAIHEERMLALLLLIHAFSTSSQQVKKRIYRLCLRKARRINNWDLVDVSAPNIVGAYLVDKNREQLYDFARSHDHWRRRTAIVATLAFIRQNDFDDTFRISKILLNDEHDLIRKAVGWMLREVGKRDLAAEERFLKFYYNTMPRTMLRYAIERFPVAKKKKYLNGKV